MAILNYFTQQIWTILFALVFPLLILIQSSLLLGHNAFNMGNESKLKWNEFDTYQNSLPSFNVLIAPKPNGINKYLRQDVTSANLYSITFTITDGSNLLPNASLTFNDKRYVSNDDGEIVINNLKEGLYNYSVYAAGFRAKSAYINLKNENKAAHVELVPTSAATYNLKLVLSDGIFPIIGYVFFNGIIYQTDEEGKVVFTHLKNGTYQLTAISQGYEMYFFNVTIDNKDITQSINLELQEFSVVFLDDDGTTVLKKEDVPYGYDATAPSDPIRANYTFSGWNKSFDHVTSNLVVKAKYNAATGIDAVNNHSIQIYPNPADNFIHVDLNTKQLSTPVDVTIVNTSGNIVLSQKNNRIKQTIDVSHLKTGIYFVTVNTETYKMLIK